MGFATGKKGYLTQKLAGTDASLRIDRDIGVSEGRLKLKDPNNRDTTYVEWLSFATNTANGDGTYTLGTLVRGLSQTADPATAGTGKTFGAGTECVLVAMHDQIPDKQAPNNVFNDLTADDILAGSLGFTSTTKGGITVNNLTTTQRDALVGVLNGTIIYNTTAGEFQIRQAGSWITMASGSTQPNASTTVAGKVEVATITEVQVGTDTGGTGATNVVIPSTLKNLYYFGSGVDGDVTISTNTTLTRDMHYNNLTINSTFTLDPNGFAIYIRGSLFGAGKIARNGNNGTSASGRPAGNGGAALNTGTCGPNLAGGNGGIGSQSNTPGAGVAGVSVNPSYATTSTNSAAGGSGGLSGGTFAPGTGGSLGTTTRGSLYNISYDLPTVMTILMNPQRALALASTVYGGLASAGGGGGGGGANSEVGGGGGGAGGNGGIIFLYVRNIDPSSTVTIEARGGNGGSGGNGTLLGGGGGGGGGGSGGVVFFVYDTGTVPTITLTGGTAGAGGLGSSPGVNGASGGTGTTGVSIITQI